jgi:nitroimidazol reductase NimA-like FMN-containing flavoprotein (pyridoxamine 5'-phosphate oxidase superfamily)
MDYRMAQEQRETFLADVHVAILSLNQPDRGPLSVPVWYWYKPGGQLWFETEPGSRKGRLLDIGTRVSLCVQDETPPYAYVSVEGPITKIAEDDLEQHQIPMAIRYLGETGGREFIDSLPPTEWKRYILSPDRWLSYDGSKAQ